MKAYAVILAAIEAHPIAFYVGLYIIVDFAWQYALAVRTAQRHAAHIVTETNAALTLAAEDGALAARMQYAVDGEYDLGHGPDVPPFLAERTRNA